MRKHAGRPKKASARKPGGRLRFQPDLGTPEALARRALAINPRLGTMEVGKLVERKEAHDRRSSYPLGVLYARHVVTGQQHYAGRRYLALFTRAVRGVGLPSLLADMVGRGTLGPQVTDEQQDDGDTRRRYLAARQALMRGGRGATAAVDDVVVYELPPGPARIDDLTRGLEALLAHFEEEDKACRR